ncbi:hypothetical protein CC80DRAFT_496791 [Byssothecium circinans]|uniref:Uncharacterized protein n=1 Tax=Byssothecium circinans TaxID=147558 RepID=A0A6A5TD66_9PLEO|nr:hypothetical protein CC80DRAFT_496791 [Byssothecium circinans]
MRYSAVIASLVAVAAARNRWTGVDTKWATHPDETADWYAAQGEAVPEVADSVTTIEEGKSYIVKVDCLGCPFRGRELYELVETWQEPAQENSLLLNFTLDTDSPALLLDDHRIAPLAPMPLAIKAFQTPANVSKDTMDKMVKSHMLDESFVLGTKYGKFELAYEHSVVGTEKPGRYYIQFDITDVHIRGSANPGSYSLNKEGQKVAQVLLQQDLVTGALHIEEVKTVERKDLAKPFLMKCGRFAIVKTVFNPLEWDSFGQFGSFSRGWNVLVHRTIKFLMGPGLLLIVLTAVVGGVMALKKRIAKRQGTVVLVENDAEAALLGNDYDDAPPEYDDVPEFDEEKEDKA